MKTVYIVIIYAELIYFMGTSNYVEWCVNKNAEDADEVSTVAVKLGKAMGWDDTTANLLASGADPLSEDEAVEEQSSQDMMEVVERAHGGSSSSKKGMLHDIRACFLILTIVLGKNYIQDLEQGAISMLSDYEKRESTAKKDRKHKAKRVLFDPKPEKKESKKRRSSSSEFQEKSSKKARTEVPPPSFSTWAASPRKGSAAHTQLSAEIERMRQENAELIAEKIELVKQVGELQGKLAGAEGIIREKDNTIKILSGLLPGSNHK